MSTRRPIHDTAIVPKRTLNDVLDVGVSLFAPLNGIGEGGILRVGGWIDTARSERLPEFLLYDKTGEWFTQNSARGATKPSDYEHLLISKGFLGAKYEKIQLKRPILECANGEIDPDGRLSDEENQFIASRLSDRNCERVLRYRGVLSGALVWVLVTGSGYVSAIEWRPSSLSSR